MPWTIPSQTVRTVARGYRGIVAWSLQKALDDLGDYTVATDGDFGPATEEAVRRYQGETRLTVDGVAGPATQRDLVERHIRFRYSADPGLPVGLLEGFCEMEGGWLLGAVNWSVAGGVDCSVLQRRVYEKDYGNDAVIERAFNLKYQGRLLSGSLIRLRDIFHPRAGTNDGHAGMGANEKAWRLAALDHNYPSAAHRLSYTPIASLYKYPYTYWTTTQSWVTAHGFRFPDGTPVRTPLEWCHLYSGVLGGKHGHVGNVTKYVSRWS